jgi:hypothetical protein
LSRLLDEQLLPLQRQGRISHYFEARGQEAGVVAGAEAILPTDYFVQGLREGTAAVYRGMPLGQVHRPDSWHGQRRGPRPSNALPCVLGGNPPRQHVVLGGLADPARHGHRHGRPRSARRQVSPCASSATVPPAKTTSTRASISPASTKRPWSWFARTISGPSRPRLGADPVGNPGRQGPGLRRVFAARRRQRRPGHVRGHQGGRGQGPRGRRPHLHRSRDLPTGRAFQRRRSDPLPRRARAQGLAEAAIPCCAFTPGWKRKRCFPPRRWPP